MGKGILFIVIFLVICGIYVDARFETIRKHMQAMAENIRENEGRSNIRIKPDEKKKMQNIQSCGAVCESDKDCTGLCGLCGKVPNLPGVKGLCGHIYQLQNEKFWKNFEISEEIRFKYSFCGHECKSDAECGGSCGLCSKLRNSAIGLCGRSKTLQRST